MPTQDVYNSPQLKNTNLAFLSTYQKPSDDIDDIPVAESFTKEVKKPASKSPVLGARNTPVETFDEDSELDSPAQRGRVRNSTDLSNSTEQKTGRRGRREKNSPQSGIDAVETINSWDSDSTGSPSPAKPGRRSILGSRSNNLQNKLSIDVNANDVPMFLQPFKEPERNSSPDLKRHTLNTTPANVSDEILDFSGDFSPNQKPTNRSFQKENQKQESRVQRRRENLGEDKVQSFNSESTDSPTLRHPRDLLPPSPGKKGGRRGGEARKQMADLNSSGDLDISWEELIPTLEDDIKRRNPKLNPPFAKSTADPKLLSYAISNSAKQSKLANNTDDSEGHRIHFRRENSEASGIGGPSPIQDLDMSIVPLDMLQDTCLSMDDALSPVYQEDSPPKQNAPIRRKPKSSGMFALTAVDTSQNSIEDEALQELQIPKVEMSPRGSEKSAFSVVITPKSSRANSIINPRDFPEPESSKTEMGHNQPVSETSEQKTVESIESMEMVSDALKSLSNGSSTQNTEQAESKKPSIKKRFSGVLSSATKFLQRSNSKDNLEVEQGNPQALLTRSRANSEHSLGNSSAGTLRASITDKDDDSVELPIGVPKNTPVIDAPISTIDISTLKNEVKNPENPISETVVETGEGSATTEQQSKTISKGIFSRTKSLTRSSSWGLKTFLGLKSSGDGNSEINSLRENSQPPQYPEKIPLEANISEIPKKTNESQNLSESEDIRVSSSKPPLSQKIPSQELSDLMKKQDAPDSDDDNSSIRSIKTGSSVHESDRIDIPEKDPNVVAPRTRTPSPSLPIKISSTRNTPLKKRDWDLDNQKEEEILLGKLLDNTGITTNDSSVSALNDIDQPMAPSLSSRLRANSSSTPEYHDRETSNLRGIVDERSITPVKHLQPPVVEVRSEDRRSFQLQQSDQDMVQLQPLSADSVPIPQVRNLIREVSKDSVVSANIPLGPIPKPVPQQARTIVREVSQESIVSSQSVPPISTNPKPPLPVSLSNLNLAASRLKETSFDTLKAEKNDVHSENQELTKSLSSKNDPYKSSQQHLQTVPTNYLDLYKPPEAPKTGVSAKSHHSSLSTDNDDVHDGLYQALLYRQQVSQKYLSTERMRSARGADSPKAFVSVGDRNILGRKLNEKILQLKKEREPKVEYPPKAPSSIAVSDQSVKGSKTVEEYYPEFILEVFPHLRVELSPFKPQKPSQTHLDETVSGQDIILAIYERNKQEKNEIERQKEPLPAHIPLHIDDNAAAARAFQSSSASQRISTDQSFKLSKRNRKINVIKSVKVKKNLVL